MNNQVFILSHGIGEMYLDVSDMFSYCYEFSTFNIDKEIPVMKLLLDMSSLRMRYYTRLNGSAVGMPQVILDIGHLSAKIVRSFIKIKDLSEDIFCTGDILTVDYCMEVYTQFLNNEPFDLFIATTREIRDTLNKIDRELFNFQQHLERLFRLLYSLLPKKSKLRKRLYETEQMFKGDFIKQSAKFVKTNGKYWLGIYTNIEGVFLERMYQ